MPLGQIDAASQRSAPGFPAILTRFATDLASIFRITLRRRFAHRIVIIDDKTIGPVGSSSDLAAGFIIRLRSPAAWTGRERHAHHWTRPTGGLHEPSRSTGRYTSSSTI